MDHVDPQLGYHQRQTPGKHSVFYDDGDMESAALDPALLDADIPQHPHQAHFRKDSFANSNGVLSPAELQGWENHQYTGIPVDQPSNTYTENDGFAPLQGQYPSTYSYPQQAHPQQWKFDQDHHDPTSNVGGDFKHHSAFDTRPYHAGHDNVSSSSLQQHPTVSQQYHIVSSQAPLSSNLQIQTPLSPHMRQDWMTLAQKEVESRPTPKRIQPSSPAGPRDELTRRDGIRKKNTRIDIPSERNIHTIDGLIEKTNDEDLLKELKQQKRLLRNREAALASRQRKKKHTEALEVKEKDYEHTITSLTNNLSDAQTQLQQWEDECQRLQQHNLDLQEEIKQRIIAQHEETSMLRERINSLTERLEAGPSPISSDVPSSSCFGDLNIAEMEALHVGPPTEWDGFNFVQNLHNLSEESMFDVKQKAIVKRTTSNSTIGPGSSSKAPESPTNQALTPNLISFVLLLGAWYISSNKSRDVANMPAEYQAAGPAVLNMAGVPVPQPEMPVPSPRIHDRVQYTRGRMPQPVEQPAPEWSMKPESSGHPFLQDDYPSNINDPSTSARWSRQDDPFLSGDLSIVPHEPPTGARADILTRSLLMELMTPDTTVRFKEMIQKWQESGPGRTTDE